MKKTLLTAVLSISLASLSACQTARVQTANNTNGNTRSERSIAGAPESAALEAVFSSLAKTADVDAGTFDKEIISIVNSNPSTFGKIGSVTSIQDLEAKISDPQAFLSKLSRVKSFGNLNITGGDVTAAAKNQEFANLDTNTGVKTEGVVDLVKPVGPLTAESFQAAIAAGADQADVDAIVAAESQIEAALAQKGLKFKVVGGGCDNLRSPASIHNLRAIVTDAKTAIQNGEVHNADDAVAVVETGIKKEVLAADGSAESAADLQASAEERFCELNDPKECAVFVIPTQVCAE